MKRKKRREEGEKEDRKDRGREEEEEREEMQGEGGGGMVPWEPLQRPAEVFPSDIPAWGFGGGWRKGGRGRAGEGVSVECERGRAGEERGVFAGVGVWREQSVL